MSAKIKIISFSQLFTLLLPNFKNKFLFQKNCSIKGNLIARIAVMNSAIYHNETKNYIGKFYTSYTGNGYWLPK